MDTWIRPNRNCGLVCLLYFWRVGQLIITFIRECSFLMYELFLIFPIFPHLLSPCAAARRRFFQSWRTESPSKRYQRSDLM